MLQNMSIYNVCIDYLSIFEWLYHTFPGWSWQCNARDEKTSYKSTMSKNCGCPIFASVSVSVGFTRFTTGTQGLSELSLGKKNITLQKLRRASTSACIFLTRDVRMSLAWRHVSPKQTMEQRKAVLTKTQRHLRGNGQNAQRQGCTDVRQQYLTRRAILNVWKEQVTHFNFLAL